MTTSSTQNRLIFVVGPPRSGSTLLMRMLSSHSEIYSRPEPHLLTPLAHLGFYDNVNRAPFDHLQAGQALAEFVGDLPRGEEAYLDALRAYADRMYAGIISTQGKPYFLDKTPAYGLILPFIAKLYPEAHFVILTRNPCSVWDSYAQSFFDGDYKSARDFNPILNRYVPAMADFMRTATVPFLHVRYEDVVSSPEETLQGIYAHIGIEHEPESVNYGAAPKPAEGGLGDPLGVAKHSRPVTSSLQKWANHVAVDSDKEVMLREMVALLDPRDITTWGYDRKQLFEPLASVDLPAARKSGKAARRKDRWAKYKFKRRLLISLRRNIHHNAFGRLIKKVRFVCDVLLRGDGESGWNKTGQISGAEDRPS